MVEYPYFEGDGVVFVEEQSYTVTAPISGSPTARRSRMCPRSSTATSSPHVACPRLLFTATKWLVLQPGSFPAGTNDSGSATNDSAQGTSVPTTFGVRGVGWRRKLRSRKVRINTVGERGPWTTTIVKE